MIKIIGIGGCGNNILEFLKKQNFQRKKSEYEFISIKNDSDLDNLNFTSEDRIFTIAGFGGSTGGYFTKLLSKKVIDNGIQIKNIIILPFNIESGTKLANKDLVELLSINQNVEVYVNDYATDVESLTMKESMKIYDERIFDRIKQENQVTWKNFIIEKQVDDTTYKALVTFWSKDYKITLLEPKFKLIASSHMPFIAPSRFAFKNEDTSSSSIQDIETIANTILENYI